VALGHHGGMLGILDGLQIRGAASSGHGWSLGTWAVRAAAFAIAAAPRCGRVSVR